MDAYYTTRTSIVKVDDNGKVVWQYNGNEIEKTRAELAFLRGQVAAHYDEVKRQREEIIDLRLQLTHYEVADEVDAQLDEILKGGGNA